MKTPKPAIRGCTWWQPRYHGPTEKDSFKIECYGGFVMRLMNFFAALPLLAGLDCAATPFWGAKHSAPADTPIEALQPGEFICEG
jgi:hypothetical protein